MTPSLEAVRDGYTISTDKSRLDFGAIHAFLRRAYWSQNVPLAVVKGAYEVLKRVSIYESPH